MLPTVELLHSDLPLPAIPLSPRPSLTDDAVPLGFEEGVLRALCDMDCGFPLLLDRIKQNMASCREASAFFRKRAQIEDDYGRNLVKLARQSAESYSISDGKAGSFVSSWNSLLRAHDIIGENHIRFALHLNETSDHLLELSREVERARKTAKDLGTRLERTLQDSEGSTEKSKQRFDAAAEELERLVLSKAGESTKDTANIPHAHSTSGLPASKRTLGKAMRTLGGGKKSPAQIARAEEDCRSKMSTASDAYRQQVLATQQIRQEYFNLQLPRMLKSLKEQADEVDLSTQFQLSRYAFLYENLMVNDGTTIAPIGGVDEGPGLKHIVEAIDNRDDFKIYMQNYGVNYSMSGAKGLRREGPVEEGFVNIPKPTMSPTTSQQNGIPSSQSFNTSTGSHLIPTPPQWRCFGVDLETQLARDGTEVPRILVKCAAAIEAHGLEQMGIYRLSGTTSRVQRLKAKLDADVEAVNLLSDENLSDINDISGVLKLFFRELPEPLMTHRLYHSFVDAAKIDNPRLRHIRLHERVNDLPDANYSTLKYLLGHLDRIHQHELTNQMSISNLAIVFGPTLLGPPPNEPGSVLQDMQWQCKALETVLEHYAEIFVDSEEPEAEVVESVQE